MADSTTTDYLPISRCLEVNEQCPIEHSIYGYYPSLGADAFLLAFFGTCAVLQMCFGIRYKTWSYMVAMALACLSEAIGYTGRLMMYQNPFYDVGFQIQICCLILGPAFNSAAIYLVLKPITLCFGAEYSRIRPAWYTILFVSGDMVSLLLQAVGGAIAATSLDDVSRREVGDHLMMAGLAFQVITLSLFAFAAISYVIRRRRAAAPFTSEARILLRKTSFRSFVIGFAVAFGAIFIRCIYRIAEMGGGWGNPIMQDQIYFIVFDGCMIALATTIQTVLHPGWCFPPLSSAYIVPVVRPPSKSVSPPTSELGTIEEQPQHNVDDHDDLDELKYRRKSVE